jgi:tRNA dimethylallyltransferase
MDSCVEPLAVLILGPTGSGKTALSLALAERFQGEIVSCDSVAVYRGMDLGSAKPTPAEQAQIAHHLIDIANPDELMTAGEYSRQAREALREIASRNRLPIVTGGTGLYLRALTEGLFQGPARQEKLRSRLTRSLTRSEQRHSSNWLDRILIRLDPEAAARIHPNDTPKLIRAIEVCLAARQPISQVFEAGRDNLTGFRILRIGLTPPRTALYEKLNRRAAQMFADGLIEETQTLLNLYGRVRPLDSLGYRQAVAILDGAMTCAEAIAAAQQGHRNYAKRQLTWFRREPDVHWIEDFGSAPATLKTATALIENHLQYVP